MRNSFARLVKRYTARPSLRERAASLKASAARVIRRKPVETEPALADSNAASPVLAAQVNEWVGLQNEMTGAASMTNEELDPKCDRANELHALICAFEARTVADMAAKLPVYEDEHAELRRFELGTQVEHTWSSVVRDIKALSGNAAVPDPILAAIAETRCLTEARIHAANLPQPAGSIDPLPEQTAALEAFFAHVDGVLLKTVPTTAAGCAALARYAVDFLADEGFVLDEQGSEHVRILELIARSPAAGGTPTIQPLADPVLAVLNRYHAARAAWDAYSDRLEKEGWDALGGIEVASAEEGRLSKAWSQLSTEVLATMPTTEAGRLALADFIETWVADHGNADGTPQAGSETIFAEVHSALLRTVRTSAGQGHSPPAQAAQPRARHFIDSFDLSRIGMRDLAAIHDAARLIAGVADAIGCQPRSYDGEDGGWNAIGLFADAISETCGGVLADTVREALDREPKNGWERGLRLKILAEHTIDNDDKAAVAIFARDFQAMA